MEEAPIPTNIDGRSDDEAYNKSAKELFFSIDKDGDGFIGVNELMNYLNVIGCKPSKEEVIKMIEDADNGKKGCLDFKDFRRMISQTSSNQTSEEEALIKDAFVAFGGDKELQDVIDLSKMTSIIENDFKLEVNVKKLLEAQDVDRSGEIDYQEFKALVLK